MSAIDNDYLVAQERRELEEGISVSGADDEETWGGVGESTVSVREEIDDSNEMNLLSNGVMRADAIRMLAFLFGSQGTSIEPLTPPKGVRPVSAAGLLSYIDKFWSGQMSHAENEFLAQVRGRIDARAVLGAVLLEEHDRLSACITKPE